MENLIEIKNVYKTYKMGKVENHALNNINLNKLIYKIYFFIIFLR